MAKLVITQLEAPSKILELTSWASPRDSVTWWSVEQRSDIKRFPGRRAATANLYGGSDGDVEFPLVWEDRHLRKGEAKYNPGGAGLQHITDAAELVGIIREMVADPVYVSIAYLDEEPVGFLKTAEPERVGGRPNRWEVNLTFSIVSPGEPESVEALSNGTTDASNTAVKSSVNWRSVVGYLNAPPSMPSTTRGPLTAAARVVNTDLISMGIASKQMSQIGGLALAGSLTGSTAVVARSARSLEALANVPDAILAGIDSPLGLLAGGAFSGFLSGATRRLRHDMTLTSRRLGSMARKETLGVHIALEGQDLRLLAFKLLGDARRWREIADLNGLTSSKLSAGQIVTIPR
jgi:hypothetical protein